jgi:DNA-binding response OmpR family regulator
MLIVEDSPEIVEAVSLCLQSRWPDIEIDVSASGLRGIEMVRKQPYDCIILDIGLPDVDGFQVLEVARQSTSAPVVIVTARGREADMVRGKQMGAADYIAKPFRARELVQRIGVILEAKKKGPA